jgi:hypothetical protein
MISDNNHIIYSAEDIQRYWNGQLSPQEMHAMEKAALDDPFLADAMEGMGLAMQEHDENILNTQLSEMRVQIKARTSESVQTARVRSFRWWQVAAAAFVLAIAGYWILSPGGSDKDGLVAKQRSTQSPEVTGSTVPNSIVADSDRASSTAPAPSSRIDTVQVTGISAKRANEPGYYKFTTPKTAIDSLTTDASESRKPLFPPANYTITPPEKKQKEQLSVARDAPQANKNLDSVRNVETEVVTLQETFANAQKTEERNKDSEPKLQNIVSGIVTDNKNNPLSNVFIRLDNRNSYTTDPLGNFKIPVSDTIVNVSVSLQGYATQNFRLRSTHNGTGAVGENQLRLQTNEEIAANGRLSSIGLYDKKAKGKFDNEAIISKITDQDAQPVYGWITYEQYLEKNKRKPASNPNLIGDVAVSFEINKKGERSGYKIERSLSADHDAEAIRLVREGPEWKLNKGRKSRVTVIVRF